MAARPAGRAGGHPPTLPASHRGRCRRRCRRPWRRDGGRRHGRPVDGGPAAGRELDRHHRGPQARGDPDAGEPVLRPLLRHAQRRPRLRRQAGPHLAERGQHLPAARLGPHRPRVPPPVQPHRPDRRRPRPLLVRRPRGVEQRTVEQLGRGQVRGDHGLLHPVRDPFPVLAGRRVHHLRRLPPGDHGADQPQPDVLLDRHVVGLDLQPERLHGRVRLRRRDGRGHHVPGAAAGGRRELAGLRQRPGRRQRQLPRLLPGRLRRQPALVLPAVQHQQQQQGRHQRAGDPRRGHEVEDRQGGARR